MHTEPSHFSRLGFGTSGLVHSGDEPTRQRLLEAAFEAGVTHFDTARYYGWGQAEGVVGRFLRGKRDQVTVTTKYGILPAPTAEVTLLRASGLVLNRLPGVKTAFARFKDRRQRMRRNQFAPADVQASLEASLRALGVERIDLYLAHELALGDISDDLIALLERFREQGKIADYGLGVTKSEEIAAIGGRWPRLVEAVQIEHSVVRRRVERLAGARLRFTHRALNESLDVVRAWLAADSGRLSEWEAQIGASLNEPGAIPSLMLLYALDTNGGTLLFSSTKAETVRRNARLVSERPFTPEQVTRFAHCVEAAGLVQAT